MERYDNGTPTLPGLGERALRSDPPGAAAGQWHAGWWVCTSEEQTLDSQGGVAGFRHELMYQSRMIAYASGSDAARTFHAQAAFLNNAGQAPGDGGANQQRTGEDGILPGLTPELPAHDTTIQRTQNTMTTTENTNHDPNDTVTIAEARRRIGEEHPTRQTFHDAIKRGDLMKISGTPGHHVHLRWGDVTDYVARGGFEKRCPRNANNPDSAPNVMEEGLVAAAGESLDILVPDVTPPAADDMTAVHAEISEIGRMLSQAASLTDDEMADHIRRYANAALSHAGRAITAAKLALANAWACGTMLNIVKKKLRHGTFGPWLGGFGETEGLNSRTLQRYMRIARSYPDIGALISRCDGRHAAYAALEIADVEPDTPPALGDGEATVESARPTDQAVAERAEGKVLASVSTIRKHLRQLDQTGGRLGDDAVRQVRLVIDELGELINRQESRNHAHNDAA